MMSNHEYDQSSDPRADYTPEQVSSYLQEIERLLERVESSTTHYHVLGVPRTATGKEITLAYRKAVTLLNPSYYGISLSIPDETGTRIDLAFSKVAHAYSVLVSVAKRLEYDGLVEARPEDSEAAEEPAEDLGAPEPAARSITPQESEEPALCTLDTPQNGFDPFAERDGGFVEVVGQGGGDRRKFERYPMALPVYVTGHERIAGEWHEITKTIDVSRTGVTLELRKRVRHRTLLHLALPLPMKLRCHRHTEPSYGVYALVRRIEPARDGARIVALEFVGERPPAGYIQKPWVTYRTKWSGEERRKEPRVERVETITVDCLNESMQTVRQMVAVTENISPGGARIYLKAAPPEFDIIRVANLNRTFESLATVCNRYVDKDGFERLCLSFLDNRWDV
ncbi:MAG TPA: PilZ domain-containing protein [Blastocatellia bacterium]|nr:PilZ domain-containing protein [Blastocatellia bacterium]